VPQFASILRRADRFFRQEKPDALVMIDFPGFPLVAGQARPAARHPGRLFRAAATVGVGSAGASRRCASASIGRSARCPSRAWFRERGVAAQYIGHPYFDELRGQRLDPAFLAAEQSRPGPVVALLPGSRNSELTNNLDSLLRAAASSTNNGRTRASW